MELLIINIGIAASLIWIIVTGIFLLAQIVKDNSIIDIFYGLIFFTVAFIFLVITKNTDLLPAIITACIGIWALRLSGRLLIKNFGRPEDARYAKWRRVWSQKGNWYFLIRSYLQINILQGIVILLILLPFIISTTIDSLSVPFVIVGVLVFLFGLTYETVADIQLDRFIARKKAGTEETILMTKGLFQLSRRPNYFGETIVWWGQAIMVLSLPFGWLGLLSPIVITYVVVKLTGPLLENYFLEKYPDEYRAYMASTSYFLPRPKR